LQTHLNSVSVSSVSSKVPAEHVLNTGEHLPLIFTDISGVTCGTQAPPTHLQPAAVQLETVIQLPQLMEEQAGTATIQAPLLHVHPVNSGLIHSS